MPDLSKLTPAERERLRNPPVTMDTEQYEAIVAEIATLRRVAGERAEAIRSAESRASGLEEALRALAACVRNRIGGWRLEATPLRGLSDDQVKVLRACADGLELHAAPILEAADAALAAHGGKGTR